MSRIIFPSLLAGNDRVFTLNDNSGNVFRDWYANSRSYISPQIGYYETYGDGMVQHAPTFCAPLGMWTDALTSLASYITTHDDVPPSSYDHHSVARDYVELYARLRYKFDKRQWYNLSTLKVTSDSRMAKLRAWEIVPAWIDGTLGNAIALYLDYANKRQSMLHIAWVIASFREHSNTGWESSWPGCFKAISDGLPEDYNLAFEALRQAHILNEARGSVARWIGSVKASNDNGLKQAA